MSPCGAGGPKPTRSPRAAQFPQHCFADSRSRPAHVEQFTDRLSRGASYIGYAAAATLMQAAGLTPEVQFALFLHFAGTYREDCHVIVLWGGSGKIQRGPQHVADQRLRSQPDGVFQRG